MPFTSQGNPTVIRLRRLLLHAAPVTPVSGGAPAAALLQRRSDVALATAALFTGEHIYVAADVIWCFSAQVGGSDQMLSFRPWSWERGSCQSFISHEHPGCPRNENTSKRLFFKRQIEIFKKFTAGLQLNPPACNSDEEEGGVPSDAPHSRLPPPPVDHKLQIRARPLKHH